MPKTHPISISCETYGLAGSLLLPDGASSAAPVPGAVVVGGPGPVPQARYTEGRIKEWPMRWCEALGHAGLGALCYDQRGCGESTGLYHEADWQALYDDARAAAEMLAMQPEISGVAAIAWDEGCSFALQLAREGRVNALVLLAPPYHSAEIRYASGVVALAERKGISDRVVQIRINQWQQEIMEVTRRVEQGERTTTTDLGGRPITTNLLRFLQTVSFNPAQVIPHVRVPVLLLHGQDDTAISPSESAAMAVALADRCERIVYPAVAHFIYREEQAMIDATDWLHKAMA